ncbi:MAG: hypothetical protein NTX30_19735 [Deltaproteobacteria bacterium]|jgi:hypothetical protein|nr:hypothetical protein [Deltaproteobacteria bacterium]
MTVDLSAEDERICLWEAERKLGLRWRGKLLFRLNLGQSEIPGRRGIHHSAAVCGKERKILNELSRGRGEEFGVNRVLKSATSSQKKKSAQKQESLFQ